MKNLITYLKTLWSRVADSQSTDVSLDCRRSDLRRSPSGLDAKWKQNPFMRFAVVLTLIFTIGIGNVCGAEQTAYTLSGTTTGGTSGYAEVSNITQSSKDWKVLGNTGISPWRIGGAKNTSGTNTNRYIYSQTAITENITKVVVTHGSMSSMTVNSVTLNVYSTAAKAVTGGTGDISSVSVTYVDDGNMTFNRPAGHNWAGRFFRIDYDLTWTSSNKAKYILFSSAVFKYDDAPACSAPAAPTISGTAAYTAGQTITLTASCVSGADASTTYTWYKGADWATARAASPVQATSTSGATFTKASCVVGDAGKYWCEASNGSGCEAHNSTGYDVTVSAGSVAVTGVSVDPTSKTIFVGETFDITPTVAPANATNKNVSWSSSATSYATVISGTVTGVAAGSSTITCTTTDGSYTATCEVTVRGVTLQARDEDGNTIAVGGPSAPTRSGATITAAANSGNYVFKQWQVTNASVASTTTTPTTISDPTGAVTVTAVYYKPVTITYKANGATFTTQTYARGGTLAFPASGPNGDTYSCTGKTFVGWVGEAKKDYSDASTPPAYATAGGSVTAAATYYAVFADASGGGSTTKTDEFTYTSFFSACTPTGANVNGAYTDFSSISGSESDAVYAGNLMEHGDGPANCHDYIQMRSKNSHSGIITTTSGGTAKKVTVEWNSAQAADKVLNIYGKSTAYSAASDLYNDATDGDLLGTITSGTSTEYSITGDYEHIGIRSADGSLLFDEISIDWQVGGGYTYSNYATTCCTPLGSVTGNIGTNTPTSVTLTWSDVSGAEKYQVKVPGSSSHNDWTDAVSGVSVTKSCGTAYTAYFRAIDTNSSHCSEGPESTLAIPAVSWTVTSTGVTNATASPAIPSTTCSGFSTTISPATGYALPADITVTNASKSWNSSTGALSISNVTGNVSITITPTCVSPVIGTDPADAGYYVGDSPDALSVSATLASGTLTYLWKVSTNGGSTWSDATGTNNTASYSGASLSTASAGTLKFKCIVGNSEGGCTVESAVATITVSNASYFPNGKTIFIQAESSSAWSDANYDCVKAWFHTAGGSETAQTTYWLFDATGGDSGKKLFAAIVPATGDLPYLDIQRFTHDCSDWRNKNGGCSYSDANGSNTIRSTGNTDTYDAKDDYIHWNVSGVTIDLYGDPSDDDWASSLASFSDQGAGVWTATYENYAPANAAGESQDFKAKTNYNGWIGNTGSNNNATLSGMIVGSTYDVTATLDIKDHSLEMSKTFVKGTVHFNLQGHGLAISDLTNVTAGSKISAPSAPSATGYTFGGWFKEPACTNAWNFASDVVNETMTLYAKWTVDTYTITKTLTNVTSSPVIPSTYTYTGAAAGLNYTISPSDGYRLPTEITVSGTTYTWNPATGALVLTGIITNNVTITISAVQTHTVDWYVGGSAPANKIGDDGQTTVVDHGGKISDFPATTPDGSACDKVFVGWTNTSSYVHGTSPLFNDVAGSPTINADAQFYAVFATGGSTTVYLTESEISTSFVSGTTTSYGNYTITSASGTWGGKITINKVTISATDVYCVGIRKNADNNSLGSPTFSGNISNITVTGRHNAGSARDIYICSSNATAQPTSGDIGSGSIPAGPGSSVYTDWTDVSITPTGDHTSFYIYANGGLQIKTVAVTYGGYSGYTITCADCGTSVTPTYTAAPTGGIVSVTKNAAAVASGSTVKTCTAVDLTVTLTPATHYTLTGFTATGLSTGTATISPAVNTVVPTTSEQTFTVTVSAGATGTLNLTPTFTPETPLTITLSTNSKGTFTNPDPWPIYSGESFTFPDVTPNDPSCATFVGWIAGTTFVGDGTTHDAPATIAASTVSDPQNSNATYTAVFYETETSESDAYVKVTSTPANWANDHYLIVYEDGGVAFDGSRTDGDGDKIDAASNTVAVSITSSAIAATNALAASEWKIALISGSNYSIQSASGKYIGNASNSNALSTSSSALVNTLSISSGDFEVVSDGGAYLRYNATSGQERFRYYKSSSYSSQQAIQLYKLGTAVVETRTYTTNPSCTPKYRVTVASVTGGSPSADPKYNPESTEVTITANPSAGYSFTEWRITKTTGGDNVTSTLLTGDKPTTASTTFLMPAYDVTVAASYAKKMVTELKVMDGSTVVANTTGSVSGTLNVSTGANKTLDVVITPSDAFDHSWTATVSAGSTYASITNVTAEGFRVNGVAQGDATITVTASNDEANGGTPKVVTFTVHVTDILPEEIILKRDGSNTPIETLIMYYDASESKGQYMKVNVSYSPSNPTNKAFTFSSAATGKVGSHSHSNNNGYEVLVANGVTTDPVNCTFTSSANGSVTKVLAVTVLPILTDRFVDYVHGNATQTVSARLSADRYTMITDINTPSLSDASDANPTSEDCETAHYHLIGWLPQATAEALMAAGTPITDATEGLVRAGVQVEATGQTWCAIWAEEQ